MLAMVTTWNKKCGISEYSRNLVYALRDLGVDVRVFSEPGDLVYEDEDFVTRFKWDDVRVFCATIIEQGFDAVHFQNQGSFWSKEWLEGVLENLRGAGIKTIVTFHDSAIWDGFNISDIDRTIVHRMDITRRATDYIPMGILYVHPRICSFGIGRNDDEAVRKICENLGFTYHAIKPQYKWLTQGELINKIREYDAVVLWYGDVGIVGCSAGVRMAIASRRKVFTSDVRWFDDVTGNIVTKCRDLEDLGVKIKSYFTNFTEDYLNANCWDLVARKHKEIYGKKN